MAWSQNDREIDGHAVEFRHEQTNRSIPECFEAAVALYGSRPAVVTPESRLTYAELNATANRLARAALALRPDAGEALALLAGQSTSAVLGLVAGIKSGKLLTVLDPTFPDARLTAQLAHSGAGLIFCDRAHLSQAERVAAGRTVLLLDEVDERYPSDNLGHRLDPDRPCYLYYTSGSTGRPKGVINSHRFRIAIQSDLAPRLAIGPEDRLTLLHPLGFVASALEVHCALFAGAALYPLDVRAAGFPAMRRWIQREGISILSWVCSGFRGFAATLGPEDALPSLRTVFLGSEPLTIRDVELFRSAMPDHCRLLYRYGSTEAGPSHYLRLQKDTPLPGPLIPVGYPVSYKEALIRGEDGSWLPAGEAGEICIRTRGCYMSPGYWRDPELTQSRFDGAAEDAARIYRTGDVGRLREDGSLECLGRVDQQVKIRGFRIETGEIEAVLAPRPELLDAVVVAVPDFTGEDSLVAFLVARPGHTPVAAELTDAIRDKLPEYMLPSRFVVVDALPLTPNGKIDRRALMQGPVSQPQRSAAVTSVELTAPSDSYDMDVAAAWERVLGVRPSLQDDFFTVGGNSLRGVQLLAAIEKESGIPLPLTVLLESRTVEKLAAVLRSRASESRWTSLVPLRAGGRKPPLFCVHGIGGGVLIYQRLAELLDRDRPVYGLQALGIDGTCPPHRTIAEMAEHYLAELRSVQPIGPYFLCGLSFGGVVAFEMAQQLAAQQQQVALLALLDTRGSGYPRFRPLPFRLGQHAHALLKLTSAQRRDYFHSRFQAVWEKTSLRLARTALRHLWKPGAALPRALRDIGLAHREALSNYAWQPYRGKVTLFRAEHQPVGCHPDPFCGWGPWAHGGVEVVATPGSHADLIYDPHAEAFVAKLQECLDRAQAAG